MRIQFDYEVIPGIACSDGGARSGRANCCILRYGMLGRAVALLCLMALASCTSVPAVLPTATGEAVEVWREVPQSAPQRSPEPGNVPQPVVVPASRLAESELPVIEPLRKPLDPSAQATVQPTVQPAVQPTATQPGSSIPLVIVEPPASSDDAALSVLEMTDAKLEVGEPRADSVPQREQSAGNESLAAGSLTPASVDGDTQTPASVATQVVTPETPPVQQPAGAEQPGSAATTQAALVTDPNPVVSGASTTSDIELMCTEVIASLAIGSHACAILDASVEGVGFVPDSADLTDSAQEVLDSVAQIMLKKENLRLSVATYSNDLDDSALGNLLARRRTLAVIRHLIDEGIESARVRPDTAPLESDVDNLPDISQYLVVLRTIEQ